MRNATHTELPLQVNYIKEYQLVLSLKCYFTSIPFLISIDHERYKINFGGLTNLKNDLSCDGNINRTRYYIFFRSTTMSEKHNFDVWMTVDQTAAYLKCSKSCLYHRVSRNDIPFSKSIGRLRFNRYTIDRWMGAKPADVEHDF